MKILQKILALCTVLALMLGFSGCLHEPAPPTNLNENVNQAEEQVSEEIDTSDWLTYRNEEYGYEIKYPQNQIELVLDGKFERGTEGNPALNCKEGRYFTIGVRENPNNLSPKDWLDDSFKEYSASGWIGKFVNDYINDQKIIKAIYDPGDENDNIGCYIEWVLAEKESRIYTIAGEFCDKNKNCLELFNQVVDTFQFTD